MSLKLEVGVEFGRTWRYITIMRQGVWLLGISIILTGCSWFGGQQSAVLDEDIQIEDKARKSTIMTTNEGLEVQTYRVDLAASQVRWSGSKPVGEPLTGTVELKSGKIALDGEDFVAAEFVIDMQTIASSNLEGASAERLVSHLSGEDFFAVEQYPESRLKITSVERLTTGFQAQGELTILKVTREFSFPFAISKQGSRLMAEASFEIDRTSWGVTYGSGGLFDNLGDALINDEIGFEVKIVAVETE